MIAFRFLPYPALKFVLSFHFYVAPPLYLSLWPGNRCRACFKFCLVSVNAQLKMEGHRFPMN